MQQSNISFGDVCFGYVTGTLQHSVSLLPKSVHHHLSQYLLAYVSIKSTLFVHADLGLDGVPSIA